MKCQFCPNKSTCFKTDLQAIKNQKPSKKTIMQYYRTIGLYYLTVVLYYLKVIQYNRRVVLYYRSLGTIQS